MARRRKRRRKYRDYTEELPELNIHPQTKRAIAEVIFVLAGVIMVLSIFDAAGAAGEIVKKVLELLLGWAAWVAPLIFFAVAAALFMLGKKEAEEEDGPSSNLRVYAGAVFFTIGLTGFLHVIAMNRAPEQAAELVKAGQGGGYFGVLAGYPLFSILDFWGSAAVFAAVIIISALILFNVSPGMLLRKTFGGGRPPAGRSPNGPAEVRINKMESAGFSAATVEEQEDSPAAMAPDEVVVKNYDSRGDERGIDFKDIQDRYRKDNWQLPAIDLLDDSHSAVDSGNIEQNVMIIQKTLQDFGIPVEMSEVNVGPTVTQYTLRPAQGIKLSQILALQNDLALALAASSIRIEAPIPGRSLVGIEVPNKATAIVRLKDIVKIEDFHKHKSNLAFSLGRDVAGHAMIADLAKMPHLLIAGATGTGKSVAINSLIISLLYRNSPEEMRLIVIDPKRVELNLYNGIPHLLTPVVTNHDKAVNALKWAVSEMDRRYEALAGAGNRNIAEYNMKAKQKLPYIVIVVDELADLMAVAQADVEAAVVRLAQMARAVGVHLVLATQRPSVDIITGLIKANITARIAFAVASQVDSRTILDTAGADKLLGAGDMLFVTAELGKPKRIQGSYITEKEVKKVVGFVRDQSGEVEYEEGILERQKHGSSISGFEGDADIDDDIFNQAVEEVRRAGKASASFLQRRLRIGYARAARLLDVMEERGIIGPQDGAKPRDVYMSDEEDI